MIKFKLFGIKTVLNSVESETLAVALEDAWKHTEYQRSLLDDDSKELPVLTAKLKRLEALQDKLGIDHVCM